MTKVIRHRLTKGSAIVDVEGMPCGYSRVLVNGIVALNFVSGYEADRYAKSILDGNERRFTKLIAA